MASSTRPPLFTLANRFDALGIYDLSVSPVRMGSRELAKEMFKGKEHHSEETMMTDWIKIKTIQYYADMHSMYCLDASGLKPWADYDADFWNHYSQLLERELNQMPTDNI